jgi:hypothetical protein
MTDEDDRWSNSIFPLCRTSLEHLYLTGPEHGMPDPVMLALNCNDRRGRQIAERRFGKERVKQVMAAALGKRPPVISGGISREDAKRELGDVGAVEFLDRIIGPDDVAVLLIDNGEINWITMPKPENPPPADV